MMDWAPYGYVVVYEPDRDIRFLPISIRFMPVLCRYEQPRDYCIHELPGGPGR